MSLTTSQFANDYGLSIATVQKYCAHKKIQGVSKSNKGWSIPENAVPPMKNDRIRLLLLCFLFYKGSTTRRPDFTPANCSERTIPFVCNFLFEKQYLNNFDVNRNLVQSLNEASISSKGLLLLIENRKKINWIELFNAHGGNIVCGFLKALTTILKKEH